MHCSNMLITCLPPWVVIVPVQDSSKWKCWCSNHDGRFTLDELLSFVDLARQRSRCYQPYEFQAQMQGYCTLQLWKTTSLGGGSEKFVDWWSPYLNCFLHI